MRRNIDVVLVKIASEAIKTSALTYDRYDPDLKDARELRVRTDKGIKESRNASIVSLLGMLIGAGAGAGGVMMKNRRAVPAITGGLGGAILGVIPGAVMSRVADVKEYKRIRSLSGHPQALGGIRKAWELKEKSHIIPLSTMR